MALRLCVTCIYMMFYFRDDDDDDYLDDNAVGTFKPDLYSEQERSMNFYTDNTDNNDLHTGTEMLDEALRQHEENQTRNGNVPLQNGNTSNHGIYPGLPTTQI